MSHELLDLIAKGIIGTAYAFIFYVIWQGMMWLLFDYLNGWKEVKEMFDADSWTEFEE